MRGDGDQAVALEPEDLRNDTLVEELDKEMKRADFEDHEKLKHFAACIVHGEPAEIERYEGIQLRQYDRPLSALGMKQAKETAQFLKSYFEKT